MTALLITLTAISAAIFGAALSFFVTAGLYSRRMNAALKHRTALLDIASHEMRTPLNAILGFVSSLRKTDSQDQAATNAALNELAASGKALNKTLLDVLEIFDITNRELEVSTQLVDISEILDVAIGVIDPKHTEITNVTAKKYWVEIDPVRIREVFTILITQCVQQTLRGEIRLGLKLVRRHGGRTAVRFEIADSSCGMLQSCADNYFVPENCDDNPFLKGRPGAVLAMNLARGIVRTLGGDISVKSAIGSGVKFKITVPVETVSVIKPAPQIVAQTTDEEPGQAISKNENSGPAAAATADGIEAPTATLLQGATVLIVDDVETNRLVLEGFVEAYGPAKIILAESGHTAIDVAKKQTIDVIFMDIQMPGMDGLEATRLIRDIHGYETTPIVPVSASSHIVNAKLCQTATMTGFIEKPVREENLVKIVRLIGKTLHPKNKQQAA